MIGRLFCETRGLKRERTISLVVFSMMDTLKKKTRPLENSDKFNIKKSIM